MKNEGMKNEEFLKFPSLQAIPILKLTMKDFKRTNSVFPLVER